MQSPSLTMRVNNSGRISTPIIKPFNNHIFNSPSNYGNKLK